MRALLDTHVWLWMTGAPDRLSAKVRRLVADARNELLLSAVTPWEIALKVAAGKLRLPVGVAEYVATRTASTRVTALPVTWLHGVESAMLPLHHHDPFDRVLVAQARLEGVLLLTADPVFQRYDVRILRA